ncbi:MAG TPA: hypothetical protein PKV58_05810 [Kaistella sp.]|nr:hypothetical protein [Kaistella sp.]HPZ25421.1 hypothetical protein [Kaistella sp.]HQD45460.1 hypothetical protein [Kaistella sp.]
MEFFIFKSQQVLSREFAIAMVTKIIFLAAAKPPPKRLKRIARPEMREGYTNIQ